MIEAWYWLWYIDDDALALRLLLLPMVMVVVYHERAMWGYHRKKTKAMDHMLAVVAAAQNQGLASTTNH